MKKIGRRSGIVWGVGLAMASGCFAQGPEAVRGFGDHLFRQGDYYRAITEYERFVFLAPEHPGAAEDMGPQTPVMGAFLDHVIDQHLHCIDAVAGRACAAGLARR